MANGALAELDAAIAALERARAFLTTKGEGERVTRARVVKMLGVNRAQLEGLIVFGHLTAPTEAGYKLDEVLAVQEAGTVNQLKPPNHDRPWAEEALWTIICTPVPDPDDFAQLRQLAEKYGRTVGSIQSLKVVARNVEDNSRRFFTRTVADVIHQIHEIKGGQHDGTAWKNAMAKHYDPALCARPWHIPV